MKSLSVEPAHSNESPGSGSRRRKGCGGAVGLIFTLIIGFFLLELVLTGVGGLLVIADPLVKADAVAVLSGGGPERLREGANIYKDKLAQYYILTETGAVIFNGNDYTAEIKGQVMELGVPGGAIMVTEKHVSSTVEEAAALKKLLRQSGLKSCTVVTDPYHTFRTRLIFRNAFRESGITIYVRPVRGDWYRSTTWWTSWRGIQTTFSEYIKLAGYMLGYREP